MNENTELNFIFQDRLSDEELDQLLDDNRTILKDLESLLSRLNHIDSKGYIENEIKATKDFICDLEKEERLRESYSFIEAMR